MLSAYIYEFVCMVADMFNMTLLGCHVVTLASYDDIPMMLGILGDDIYVSIEGL